MFVLLTLCSASGGGGAGGGGNPCHEEDGGNNFLLMLIFNPPSPAFFPLPSTESICGNPSCSIANSVLASFASTTAREGLEKALAQAERRETSGMKTLSDDTPVEVEGGGDGGGGGGSFWDPQLVLLDCLRFSF